MTTTEGSDPLARAVLAKLAETHGKDTPLGSFARSVLSGDATLREAANDPWHGEALGRAYADAAKAHAALSPEARAEIEQVARKLAGAMAAGTANADVTEHAAGDDEPDQDGRQ